MTESSQRLDTWLWHARFCKTRTLATKFSNSGRVRVNGTLVSKAHHAVRPGDVLTLPLGSFITVVRIMALAARRGPAPEARTLYDTLSAPPEKRPSEAALPARPSGQGRPTKAERRALDRLRGHS